METCYKCKKNVERVRYFTYSRAVEFKLCHECYNEITKSFCEEKTHRESFLKALRLPENGENGKY